MGMQGRPSQWRKQMLSDLKQFKDTGFVKKVKWLTARDEHVCPLCAAREGKSYSFEEAKKELEGTFCKPRDPDDRCRCCFIADESSMTI